MPTYKDGDPAFSVLKPGETLPRERSSSPTGDDFAWVKPGFLERARGRSLARSIDEMAGGLNVATKFNNAAKAYEESRQALVHARDQAALLPLKLEQERQRLEGAMLQGQARLSRVLQEQQQEGEQSAAVHELFMLEAKEKRLRLKAKVKAAKRALKSREETAAPPQGDGPEAFRRHWATEQEVRRNRAAAEARIALIYERARAERRNLTADEIEEVDALADSAQAAEADVRRRAASGL